MTSYAVPSPLLSPPGAVVAEGADAGVAAHYGDPMREQRLLTEGLAAVDLSHRGVVTITGPDRLSWLHSMTTQALTGLAPGIGTESLVLSPKGHIEHALHVVDDGATTWLTVEPGTSGALVAWLERMRFMLRVEVADVTDRYAVVGEPFAESAAVGEPIAWGTPGRGSSTRCRSGGRGGSRHTGRWKGTRRRGDGGAKRSCRGRTWSAMSGTGRWPGSGRPRPCGSRRGGRDWGLRPTTGPWSRRSTGCARRCIWPRGVTAGRRRWRGCTTSAIRRGGWCSCTWTGRGTCCPNGAPRCGSRVGRTRRPGLGHRQPTRGVRHVGGPALRDRTDRPGVGQTVAPGRGGTRRRRWGRGSRDRGHPRGDRRSLSGRSSVESPRR